ncbi:MAG: dipeptide epimerase [Bacteroidales bacterium]|jgi:L-alanine-DL-glutamate epimerase-like enolase superfamily enzyme|nr:dipeptide epimerase [Bacteroidales bacterium]
MTMNKREFIKYSSYLIGGTYMGGNTALTIPSFAEMTGGKKQKGKLVLRYKPYTLQLKHTFTLATSSRTTTPVVLTEIEYDGIRGFGEASMPPYLGESHESVMKFLSLLNLSQFSDPFLLVDILDYVDKVMPGNYAAKASVDIALHDLIGKLVKEPFYRLFGLNPDKAPLTSFTIGLDSPEVIKQKVAEAEPYKILKVKLGRDNDREMVEVIRSITDKPLCVDVNQGWKDRGMALEMAVWLKEKGIMFLEQPMPKEMKDDIAWLTERSPLPVIGDEAIQNAKDIMDNKDVYSGINIKLMKCGGINAAMKMINVARALGMKVMIGCMTETSCAVTAAAQLAPLVDWCDLDGNLLIANDPFDGLKIVVGRVTLPERPGIGVKYMYY